MCEMCVATSPPTPRARPRCHVDVVHRVGEGAQADHDPRRPLHRAPSQTQRPRAEVLAARRSGPNFGAWPGASSTFEANLLEPVAGSSKLPIEAAWTADADRLAKRASHCTLLRSKRGFPMRIDKDRTLVAISAGGMNAWGNNSASFAGAAHASRVSVARDAANAQSLAPASMRVVARTPALVVGGRRQARR
jgi:hypothetical protein